MFNQQLFEQHLKTQVKENMPRDLVEPVNDILFRGGKRWRPRLMLLSYKIFGGKEDISSFLPIVEIIHNGTLIIDDIEDGSELRRGEKCIHKKHGIDTAINTGNLMYFLPYKIIEKGTIPESKKMHLSSVICDEMLQIHIGQGLDIQWHNSHKKIPAEKEYFEMCSKKTGALARMATKLAGVLAEAKQNQIQALSEFAESLSVAFQIQDDVLNLTSKNLGKEFCEDIAEGKKSLVMIHAINNSNKKDGEKLLQILSMKNSQKAEEALSIIKKSNSINYAVEKCRKMTKCAIKKLCNDLPESEARQQLLELSNAMIKV